jgi:signal transduction histidine kinase
MERTMAGIFLAVRTVHVAQGTICWITGRRAYRRRGLVAASTAGAIVELGWLVARDRRLHRHDALAARVDAVACLVGLISLAAATEPDDRTTSMNWMLPAGVGSTLGASFGLSSSEAAAFSAALAGTYLGGVWGTARRSGGPAATAVANTASFPLFFAIGDLLSRFARRMAGELDEARRVAVEQSGQIAAERARNAAHRSLHDSALQTLEVLARETSLSDEDVRRIARREADGLRRALAGDGSVAVDLADRLIELADRYRERGLHVELVISELGRAASAEATGALSEAAGEALTNVVKHAGVSRVVVRAASTTDGTRVTVRDHGKGFDTGEPTGGFGIEHSIDERMREVGGRATVWSEVGRGTRVELWAPS